ncbi:recombinase family protein, partial [Patescibacteria group bacterium]|nr:recombinase family protein [Patescibacteria group bacterium]
MKYIIYCRKSTDVEDKQALSLDAQERELLEIANKNKLNVVKILRESKSAKSTGRPVFNEVMKMIETGKADSIICWKLDRLARNFIDGGKIIDLLQKSVIQEIRTYESIHLPNDNVLLLAVQLGMANQYIRDLSTNVKRGNREKLNRGEWPNHAPFGYLNDKATKTIVVDPIRSKYVSRAYNLYLTGSHSFKSVSDVLYEEGLRTKSDKKVFKSQIQRILSSIFYTGLMKRDEKYYEGKHKPLISREQFDKAQEIMNGNSRPRSKKLFFPLRGFIKCKKCDCSFTASIKKGHHYYYCTNGKQICDEHKSYLRENKLYGFISDLFNELDFTERKIELMYKASKEKLESNSEYLSKALDTLKNQFDSLEIKESRLLDTFLSEQINQNLYDKKILELQNEKICLKKQIK